MTKQEKKQESVLIKIYLIALFLCGVGLWFVLTAPAKEKVAIDSELEQKVVDSLAANGVKQADIISQYARGRETSSKQWNEFYKKIQLCGNKKPENFENSFRAVARSMKLGLSKTDNVDGSVTYRFYSRSRNYSNITFVAPQKTARTAEKNEKDKPRDKN